MHLSRCDSTMQVCHRRGECEGHDFLVSIEQQRLVDSGRRFTNHRFVSKFRRSIACPIAVGGVDSKVLWSADMVGGKDIFTLDGV
jgi:hypothetical protein